MKTKFHLPVRCAVFLSLLIGCSSPFPDKDKFPNVGTEDSNKISGTPASMPYPEPEKTPLVTEVQKEQLTLAYEQAFQPRSRLDNSEIDLKNYLARTSVQLEPCLSTSILSNEKKQKECSELVSDALAQIKNHQQAAEEEWQRVKQHLRTIGATSRLPDHEEYAENFRSKLKQTLKHLEDWKLKVSNDEGNNKSKEWEEELITARQALQAWQPPSIISSISSRPGPEFKVQEKEENNE